MNKLNLYKFADIYELSSGISSKPDQAGHGSPFVSFKTVFNSYFLPTDLTDLMNSSENEQNTYSVRMGDIFLTRTSETLDELGMSSVAIKDYPKATFSGFLKRLRPIKSGVTYHKYMAFYLRSSLFRKVMSNNAIMTLRSSFNEQIFSYLNLLLPPYEDQKKIGDALFLIYQKIELNNRINAELEAMAKTLYDYWFVQFDFPDTNGKPYKSSGGKMVYNEELKREIPEGWGVKTIDELCDVSKGSLITEKDTKDGNIKVVAGGIDYSYKHSEYNREKNIITISASGANAGFVNFWRERVFASDCTTVRGQNDIDTFIVYNYLQSIQKFIYRQARGSAQPHVYPNDIKQIYFICIPSKIKNKISKLFAELNDKISVNQQENQQLSSLHDWLLPMLINGQVGFKSAYQEQTENAGMAAEPKIENKSFIQQDQQFKVWLSNQGLAARGDVDKATLREIFNVMDEEEYGK